MSETAVERRLREIREGGTQCAIESPSAAERDAIDAGREAIALLREWDEHDLPSSVWVERRAALLARCEGETR